MDGFKEFLGRTLDDAISDACAYYDESREKLEIEILEDAKTGIFGIVGARKAKIRARRARLRDAVQSVLGEISGRARQQEEGAGRKGQAERGSDRKAEGDQRQRGQQKSRRQKDAEAKAAEQPKDAARDVSKDVSKDAQNEQKGARPQKGRERPEDGGRGRQAQGRQKGQRQPAAPEAQKASEKASDKTSEKAPAGTAGPAGKASEKTSDRASEQAQERQEDRRPAKDRPEASALERAAVEAVGMLVAPLFDAPPAMEAAAADNAVTVTLGDGGGNALLWGGDGSTLASVQYLAGRLVSRKFEVAVRVRLDAGEDRRREEEELRREALALAEKARETGKTFSTKPLDAWRRRVVHLALRGEEDVLTKSAGGGRLRRVLVLRRKSAACDPAPAEAPAPAETPAPAEAPAPGEGGAD